MFLFEPGGPPRRSFNAPLARSRAYFFLGSLSAPPSHAPAYTRTHAHTRARAIRAVLSDATFRTVRGPTAKQATNTGPRMTRPPLRCACQLYSYFHFSVNAVKSDWLPSSGRFVLALHSIAGPSFSSLPRAYSSHLPLSRRLGLYLHLKLWYLYI